jgi:hypothetical protein
MRAVNLFILAFYSNPSEMNNQQQTAGVFFHALAGGRRTKFVKPENDSSPRK